MNQRSDIDRLLRHWMDDGPSTMPDRVVDVVADRISVQPQRLTWRLLRRLPMNPLLKLTAAVAAVLVVAVAGYNLLPAPAGPGDGPSPTPLTSPSPTPSRTAEPISCEDDLPGCAGPLTAGSHSSSQLEPGIVFDVPPGWSNVVDLLDVYKLDPESGFPYILIWTDASIVDQATPCSTDPDPALGQRADDWIAFLTTHPGLVASEPVDLVLGDITARQVELGVAPTWTQTCPESPSVRTVVLLNQPVAGRPSSYGLGSNNRVLITVADVGDRTVVIESYGSELEAVFASEMEDIKAVIGTIRFCGPRVTEACQGS